MPGKLEVTVLSDVDTETFERLEDSIRDLLERKGLKGIIEDSQTGNTTMTRDEMIDRSEKGLLI